MVRIRKVMALGSFAWPTLYLSCPLERWQHRTFCSPDETFLSCLSWEIIHIFSACPSHHTCPSPRPYAAAALTVPPEIKGKLCSAVHKTPHASNLCQWLRQKQQQQFIPLFVLWSPWKLKWTMAHSTSELHLVDTRSFDLIYLTKPTPNLIYHFVQILSSSHPTTATLTLRHLTSYELNANTKSYHLSWHCPKKRSQTTHRLKKIINLYQPAS